MMPMNKQMQVMLQRMMAQNPLGADIVNRLQPPPIPAYQVPNPYAGYGYTGCGCGCGCG